MLLMPPDAFPVVYRSPRMNPIIDLPPHLADTLGPLSETIADALLEVQRVFDRQLRSDLPPVSALCRHVEHYRGKMLRPTLVIACGLAAHPRAASASPQTLITPGHHVIGAVIEMVHMATLVHDDVLDEADTRRRGDTINRLYGNEAAVMLGDYLIASAYHLCSTLPDNRAALAVGRASVITCAGELLQLHHRDDYSIDEPTYFEVVSRKTAELIATAAEQGAAQSGASEAVCRAMADFGRKLGVAFQIQDDLLDLTGKEAIVGKSVGKDLEKGKMTLPFVHHLANADQGTRARSLLALEAADDHARAELYAALEQTGSIDYARTTAKHYVADAVENLSVLPDTPARTLLRAMADAVINRAY
jgi:octaprenyl-diphosphate synthase